MFRRREVMMQEVMQNLQVPADRQGRRHSRRPIRSSLTGPLLIDPNHRTILFRGWAGAVIHYLRNKLHDDLEDVEIGFVTAPVRKIKPSRHTNQTMTHEIDRKAKRIVLYRMPIQRFRGLHVNDDDHRRMYVEHCVYLAVCDYLEADPWNLLPGEFDHY